MKRTSAVGASTCAKSEQGVAIDNLVADVKGLHIESTGDTYWSGADGGRTHFKGTLHAGDLATVLPQWNYAPSLETTSTNVDADVGLGRIAAELLAVRISSGMLSLKAEKGRFVDLGEGSGAVRVFSLLNFAAIAKRMTLDFSDVFGKGISFDQITGSVMADRGVITFIEPMDIDGTGGDFRINGTVNLINGVLDNEMVVTLPVSSSLPWYAAYLGFVNPIAAGAVLVGERLFRNQIDKMSSAKYKVTGTLQNPEVNFQQVFPKAMDGTAENALGRRYARRGAAAGRRRNLRRRNRRERGRRNRRYGSANRKRRTKTHELSCRKQNQQRSRRMNELIEVAQRQLWDAAELRTGRCRGDCSDGSRVARSIRANCSSSPSAAKRG